jgi:hypothetical protein
MLMLDSIAETTKKMYYNAGRYAAGARDKNAVADYYRLSVIEAVDND